MSWMYSAKQNESEVGGIECLIVFEDGSTKVLDNLGYHSPDGFQIGYGGSGPADLAYSILMDYMLRSKEFEMNGVPGKTEFMHQHFKRSFVAVAKKNLEIDSESIKEWIEKFAEKANEDLRGIK